MNKHHTWENPSSTLFQSNLLMGLSSTIIKQLLQITKEDTTIVEDYLEEPLEVKEDRYFFYLNRQLNFITTIAIPW